MTDKIEELRWTMADKSLRDVKSIIKSFGKQTGRIALVSGGGVYMWDVDICNDWRVKTQNVPVKFDITGDIDSEAVELAWEIEATWNGWMKVIDLFECDLEDAWQARDFGYYEEIDEKKYEYIDRAIEDVADAMERWLGSAEDLPWDMDDEEVIEHMSYDSKK